MMRSGAPTDVASRVMSSSPDAGPERGGACPLAQEATPHAATQTQAKSPARSPFDAVQRSWLSDAPLNLDPAAIRNSEGFTQSGAGVRVDST